MKILFFSDIHGIVTNLEYIKELDVNEKFDKIIVLGDLYYMGFNHVNLNEFDNYKVKDFLMSFGDRLSCVRGNCDSDLDVKVSDFPIEDVISLVEVDDLNIYCTHGHYYSYSNRDSFNKKGILIYGHEHIPYIKKEDDVIFICVGSISLPRGNSDCTYAIFENKRIIIYDIEGNVVDGIDC